jgi:methylglutaconyl-CoA hydratase
MDAEVEALANRLASSNPEAMAMLKGIFWEGTENWDQLLADRAAMSGKLVLSDFTVNAINKFKKK